MMNSLLPRLFLITALLLGGCDESPTGRRQFTLLPDQQLAAMGERAFADLKRTKAVETDPRMGDALPSTKGCL